MIVGCAGEMHRREGLSLLREGKVEEGLAALAKAVAELKIATQTIAKLNDSNAELNRIIQSLTESNKNQQSQIDALNSKISALLVPKVTTIVCAKGTTLKTVKGLNPVCPVGFKKK